MLQMLSMNLVYEKVYHNAEADELVDNDHSSSKTLSLSYDHHHSETHHIFQASWSLYIHSDSLIYIFKLIEDFEKLSDDCFTENTDEN